MPEMYRRVVSPEAHAFRPRISRFRGIALTSMRIGGASSLLTSTRTGLPKRYEFASLSPLTLESCDPLPGIELATFPSDLIEMAAHKPATDQVNARESGNCDQGICRAKFIRFWAGCQQLVPLLQRHASNTLQNQLFIRNGSAYLPGSNETRTGITALL